MQKVILLILSTCCVANLSLAADGGFDTMLVQGRADTIRTLRNIVRSSARKSLEKPVESSSPPSPPLSRQKSPPKNHSRQRKIQYVHKTSRSRRHISHVIVESGQCDHVDLVDCSDYETDEMTCMLTATGMTCCVCTGLLRQAKRSLF